VRGKVVLDLGCGDGWFSIILAKRGAQVTGIDISEVAISVAKRRAQINNVESSTDFKVMSFHDLDFPDNYFDKIIGLSTLHHSGHKEVLRDQLYRILKPGGQVIFNEPFGNCEFLEKARLFIPVDVQEEDKTHWNEQIKYQDIEVFKEKFNVSYKEFQFFSRLDRIIKSPKICKVIGEIDLFLLEKIKFLRPLARDIVISFSKP